MLALFILLPLAAVVILNIFPRKRVQDAALLAGLLLCILQFGGLLHVLNSGARDTFPAVSAFLRADLGADMLSVVFLAAIALVAFVSLLTAYQLVPAGEQRFNFVNVALLSLTGMNGIVLVRDLFTQYVFLEIVSVASFILISSRKDRDGFESAFKYLMLSAAATVAMLLSLALLLMAAGDTSFAALQAAVVHGAQNKMVVLAAAVFIGGLLIKSGLVPFHGWLPDAYMAAPAPVSVLLGGIVTKTVGIYTLMRVTQSVFVLSGPLRQVFLLVAALSMVAGALAALGQKDFKRMLAYSSISQMGYILAGASCGTALGLSAAIFHIFNHAVFKSLFFINAAAVESRVGSRNMDSFGGLAKQMPVTGLTSVIAALSAGGMPPAAGFWSKLLVIIALWSAGFHLYAMIAAGAGILTLGYLLTMQRRVFFGALKEGLGNVREAGTGIAAASLVLAVIIIGVGIWFPFAPQAFGLAAGYLK